MLIVQPLGAFDFGAGLLRAALALLAVSALAVLVLRSLRGRLPGGAASLRVLDRLALEPRRTLYLVEVAGRVLLVGVGEGPMSVLAELDAAKLPAPQPEPAAPGGGIAAAVRRLVRGRAA